MNREKDKRVPRVRVVSGIKHEPALRAKVHDVIEPGRHHAERAISFVFGMWPLFALCGLMFFLAWGIAMLQSP